MWGRWSRVGVPRDFNAARIKVSKAWWSKDFATALRACVCVFLIADSPPPPLERIGDFKKGDHRRKAIWQKRDEKSNGGGGGYDSEVYEPYLTKRFQRWLVVFVEKSKILLPWLANHSATFLQPFTPRSPPMLTRFLRSESIPAMSNCTGGEGVEVIVISRESSAGIRWLPIS